MSLNDTLTPARTKPDELVPSRYALQIGWSDGHSSGIYSWDLLLKLESELAAAKS